MLNDSTVPKVFDPAHSVLSFIAMRSANKDSTVHIEVPLMAKDLMVGGVEQFEYAVFNRTRSLCGRVLLSTKYVGTSEFDDNRICVKCHTAMGKNAVRIFER